MLNRRKSRSRSRRGLLTLKEGFRKHRHDRVEAQPTTLCQKQMGHVADHRQLDRIPATPMVRGPALKAEFATATSWRKARLELVQSVTEAFTAPASIPIHSVCRLAAKSWQEELNGRNRQVQIRGSPGRAISLGAPACFSRLLFQGLTDARTFYFFRKSRMSY